MAQYIEFANNNIMLVASFFALLTYVLFSEYRTFTQKFQVISSTDAIQIINQDDCLLLDVREANELSEGAIANHKHIPLGSVAKQINDLNKFKEKDIIVYCRSGHRSASACRTLTNNGFEKIYNLKGGMMAWQDAQLPIVRK